MSSGALQSKPSLVLFFVGEMLRPELFQKETLRAGLFDSRNAAGDRIITLNDVLVLLRSADLFKVKTHAHKTEFY